MDFLTGTPYKLLKLIFYRSNIFFLGSLLAEIMALFVAINGFTNANYAKSAAAFAAAVWMHLYRDDFYLESPDDEENEREDLQALVDKAKQNKDKGDIG